MHNEFKMLMSAMLDGEAEPREEVRLREHLTTCPSCAEIWALWAGLHEDLLAAPVLTPCSDLMAGVEARILAGHDRRSRSRWVGSGLMLIWTLVLAGFWFGVGAVALWGVRNPQQVSVLLSTVAQLLGSVSWYLRGLNALATNLGRPTLVLGAGIYLALTGGMVLLWSFVASRGRQLNPMMIMAGK